jgi:hypothetical protein
MQNQCELLTVSLAAYEKVLAELEEFRGRVTRAEADEQAVLADGELSEHETVKRLGEAQKLKGIYSARVAHHERQLTELSTALEASARAAEQELIGLINTEAGRRSDAVKQSVIKVLAIDGNPEVLIGSELRSTPGARKPTSSFTLGSLAYDRRL